jgi:hypothetical protein
MRHELRLAALEADTPTMVEACGRVRHPRTYMAILPP